MVNRRALRIKVMQALYALHRCNEANFNLSIEQIKEDFLPDLNSMEVQDKAQLSKDAETSIELFKKHFNDGIVPDKSYSDEIKKAVSEAHNSYINGKKKDQDFLRKNMVVNVEKIHDWYLMLLLLLVEFGASVGNEIEENKTSHTNKTLFYSANLLHNKVLAVIKEDSKLELAVIKKGLSWERDKSKVRQWFKSIIKKDETFVQYQSIENPTWEDDMAIVEYLLKSIVIKNEAINDYVLDADSNWDENRHIAKGLLKKTLKSLSDTKTLELLDLSYNWEEDKEFFIDLYTKTQKADKEYELLVSEKTQNWDIERVAIVDKVIMKLAICEMTNFPSIPVKVTINEYLELAKVYSTPKSRQFINGLLDKLADELKESGEIKKSGRGLIDNK